MATTAAQTNDAFSTLIGRLYELWSLDCLIDIGYAVSVDFVARPQLYLSDDIPDAIVQLRTSYGMTANFPNTAQRQMIMMPIFGRSDALKPDASNGSAPFHIARNKFLDAVKAFAERAVDTGIAMLEERVRSAAVPLDANFRAFADVSNAEPGKSLRLTGSQIEAISKTVASILVAPSVARVFSVSAADPRWPFDSTDPNGAKLVENAGSALPVPPECKLGYTKFILLQRVAQEGAQTLPLLLSANLNDEAQLLALISRAYTWGTSLRDFQQLP
jgi:hypothetical protein